MLLKRRKVIKNVRFTRDKCYNHKCSGRCRMYDEYKKCCDTRVNGKSLNDLCIIANGHFFKISSSEGNRLGYDYVPSDYYVAKEV